MENNGKTVIILGVYLALEGMWQKVKVAQGDDFVAF